MGIGCLKGCIIQGIWFPTDEGLTSHGLHQIARTCRYIYIKASGDRKITFLTYFSAMSEMGKKQGLDEQ